MRTLYLRMTVTPTGRLITEKGGRIENPPAAQRFCETISPVPPCDAKMIRPALSCLSFLQIGI